MLCKKTFIKVRRYLFLVPELRDSLWSRKSSKLFLEISKLKLQKYFTFYHIVRPLPSFKFACKILQKGACQVYNWLWSRDFLDGILTNNSIFFTIFSFIFVVFSTKSKQYLVAVVGSTSFFEFSHNLSRRLSLTQEVWNYFFLFIIL